MEKHGKALGPPFDQRAYEDEVRGQVTDVAVILTVALSAMERRTASLHFGTRMLT
jgi:hypothetical protein